MRTAASVGSVGQRVMNTIVKIETDLDAANVGQTVEFFEQLAADSNDVVLDLCSVAKIDGCGMGALLHVFKRKSALGAKLSLVNVSGQPRQVLTELKVLSLLEYSGDATAFEQIQVVPSPAHVRNGMSVDTAISSR